jgi:2-polyprenyl-3-methyl-5-hydroxy-6-metoxy-1,4-benzoquinol methylase
MQAYDTRIPVGARFRRGALAVNEWCEMNRIEPAVLDDNSGERMVPEVSGGITFWEHVHRYAFACRYVEGKRVLDIACGEGYGAAALLKSGATQVIGVDISESACAHARAKYGVDARTGTAEQIPLPDSSADVVVSFETVEHVPRPDRFIDECVRVLAPGGVLIISTPNKGIYGVDGPANPHHCSEMTEEEFSEALRARFRAVKLYTQHPYSASWWSLRSLASEVTPWKRVRLFDRLYRSLQFRLANDAVREPTTEQRMLAVDVILRLRRRSQNLLNPCALRRQRSWTGEKPTYVIATAVRY